MQIFSRCRLFFAAVSLAMGLVFSSTVHADQSPSIGDQQVFPADNPWHWDISKYPVHPNSNDFISSIGPSTSLHPDFGTMWEGAPIGIPYCVVSGSAPRIPVNFTDAGDESDPGPYRLPLTAPVEGGESSDGDRHVIAVDTANDSLYELYSAFPRSGSWEAYSGAVFDLASNDHHPDSWTSADAAGLPIFPGLVRYEEVMLKGEINHAIRMTVVNTQKAYIWPARHYASESTNPDFAPMGLRFRLKASVDISEYPAPAQVVLRAMKKYGTIIADNGSNLYISGAPDERWDDEMLNTLKQIKGRDFEAVLTVKENGEPIFPAAIRAQRRRHVVNSRQSRLAAAGTEAYLLDGTRISSGNAALPPGAYIVYGRAKNGAVLWAEKVLPISNRRY